MRFGFILLVMLGSLAGCKTSYEEARTPTGLVASDFQPPTPGTKLSYRTYIGKTLVKQDDWTVLIPSQDYGFPTYALKSGARVVIYNRQSGNWVATLSRGRKIKSASPDNDQMRHPLWPGKKWMSAHIYRDHEADREWSPTQNFWSVEARETIKVEAGRFETFRIKSSPGLHSSTSRTIWFSPKLGVDVKRDWKRLEDHYLGAENGRIELVKISAPKS